MLKDVTEQHNVESLDPSSLKAGTTSVTVIGAAMDDSDSPLPSHPSGLFIELEPDDPTPLAF